MLWTDRVVGIDGVLNDILCILGFLKEKNSGGILESLFTARNHLIVFSVDVHRILHEEKAHNCQPHMHRTIEQFSLS
jgi:hypothetical protein